MSVTTTWGRVASAAASSSSKSAAMPTTSRSGSRPSSARTPSRTEQVVVGQQHGDRPVALVVAHAAIDGRKRPARQGGGPPAPGDASIPSRCRSPWWRIRVGCSRCVAPCTFPSTERIESRVTAVSWIPSEAVTGAEQGGLRHGRPLRRSAAGRDRRRRHHRAGRHARRLARRRPVPLRQPVGRVDRGRRRRDRRRRLLRRRAHREHPLDLGSKSVTFQAAQMPTLQAEPVYGDGWVRFEQTAGGRTGVPAPRRVNHPPFVQFRAPLAWSTLRLTLHADGRSEFELAGASRFPRHWVYGADGRLAAKAGSTDFKDWYRHAFGRHTPWGDTDTPAFVTAVETALERQLSTDDHARRRQATAAQAQGGRRAHRAGSTRRRALPRARRRPRGRGRRHGRRRGRPRRGARRAGDPRGRNPHVDAADGDAVPHRGRDQSSRSSTTRCASSATVTGARSRRRRDPREGARRTAS